MIRMLLGMILLAGLALLAGCESREAQEWPIGQSALAVDAPPDSGLFNAEVTFCRKVGKKSGKRIGIARNFQPAQKRSVSALVDFSNVQRGRLYAVHLAWIRPDGKEMFRRYAEVTLVAAGESEGFETVIDWKKAENLHYLKQNSQTSATAEFTLSTRLNISHSRQREPGDYLLRVYLDRRLLLEEMFTLEAAPGQS